MLFQKITLVLAATYTVCASTPEPTKVERANIDSECTSVVKAISPILTATPTAPASLINFIAQQTQWTTLDNCEVPWVTGSIASQFTSYMSARSSWQNDHKSELARFVSACGDDLIELGEDAGVDLSAITQTCDEYLWATSTARPTSNKNDDKGSEKESDKGSAASRLSGTFLGVALAASVVAVGLV